MMQATLGPVLSSCQKPSLKPLSGSARGLMVWLAPGPRPREDLYELDPSVPIKPMKYFFEWFLLHYQNQAQSLLLLSV